jgi:hypothetical protein
MYEKKRKVLWMTPLSALCNKENLPKASKTTILQLEGSSKS